MKSARRTNDDRLLRRIIATGIECQLLGYNIRCLGAVPKRVLERCLQAIDLIVPTNGFQRDSKSQWFPQTPTATRFRDTPQ